MDWGSLMSVWNSGKCKKKNEVAHRKSSHFLYSNPLQPNETRLRARRGLSLQVLYVIRLLTNKFISNKMYSRSYSLKNSFLTHVRIRFCLSLVFTNHGLFQPLLGLFIFHVQKFILIASLWCVKLNMVEIASMFNG